MSAAGCGGSSGLGDETAATAAPSRDATTSSGTSPGVEFDFVHGAASGSLTATPDGPGTHLLELDGVEATGVAFSDRPDRVAGRIDTAMTFPLLGVSDAPGGEAAGDPPNAALVVDAGPTVVIEVLAASWDATERSLSLSVDPLEVDGSPAVFGAAGATAPLPEAFGASSLFVDASAPERSIHVIVENMEQADLTIASAEVSSGDWVEGAEPETGGVIPTYSSQRFGIDGGVQTALAASIVLTGDGEPIELDLSFAVGAQPSVSSNSASVRVEQLPMPGSMNAAFTVALDQTG